MKIRKIIVTGGAGFIGSHLVKSLLVQGHHVLNIDCLSYAGSLANLGDALSHPAHEFLHANITDLAAMKAAFAKFSPDWIFHLAAESHVDRSIHSPMDFLATNVVGTGILLQAALDHWLSLKGTQGDDFRFVHVSTDEVFGSLGDTGAFHESSAYSPRSPYSASKAASDHLVRAWGITYGLPIIVTNCSNNYGTYQFPEKLIPTVIVSVLEGRKIPVYGQGLQVRDWVHVEDHCDALVIAAEKGVLGETYLIGGQDECRNIDLVQELCAILKEQADLEGVIEFVADRLGHDYRYGIDSTKIHSELGWTPRWNFQKGLRDTVIWYLQNRDWWEQAMSKQSAPH